MTGLNTNNLYEVDCLANGSPHGQIVSEVLDFFDSVGDSAAIQVARAQFVVHFFSRTLKLRHKQYVISDYVDLLRQEFKNAQENIRSILSFSDMLEGGDKPELEVLPLEETTSAHYSSMFSSLSEQDFFEISPRNLKELFSVNGFSLPNNSQKLHALDAGSGSGRYSYALHEMGFGRVTGVDYSQQNVNSAQCKIASKNISGIEFLKGDVSDLPFDSASFDFVFSNGVLHHANASYAKTLSEIYRVLKPGGTAFLYVMEKPGGILHDTIEMCRVILRNVPESITLKLMGMMGFTGYRIYSVLDHVYAPINVRIEPAKIERLLVEAGFSEIQRFQRGLPSDDAERLFNNPTDSEKAWKYGVGENRYILTKN